MNSLHLKNCVSTVDFHFCKGEVAVAIVDDYQRCECNFNLKEFLGILNDNSKESIIFSIKKNSIGLKIVKDNNYCLLEYLESKCTKAHFAKIILHDEQMNELKQNLIKNL